jgi:hypothetical protein
MQSRKALIRCVATMSLGLFLPRSALVQPLPQSRPDYQQLIGNGGRVDWLWQGYSLIAFDRLSPRGYYDVYTARRDGTAISCLTCDVKELPSGQRGNPAWHP